MNGELVLHDPRGGEWNFTDLQNGDPFVYEDEIYIRTNLSHAINLKTGKWIQFGPGFKIYTPKKLKIEWN